MRIMSVQVERHKEMTELSAMVDGYHLWFRFPKGLTVSARGDAFLAAALQPAMLMGEPLEIDPQAPVSPKLLEAAESLQDVFSFWYPFHKRVPIRATTSESPVLDDGVASFFSGGVDGMYTFLKHRQKIGRLLFVKGIDMQLENDALFEEALASNQRFATLFGVELVPISTNVRFFAHAYPPLNWIVFNGAGLASIALALGISKVFIASTHTYEELFPWGSHPLTDPLWSTEATAFIHDGAEARRSDKLRAIGREEAALAILRVCWQDKGYNCGTCEKCLRTMIGLRALGLTASTLPPLVDLSPVERLGIYDDSELSYVQDNIRLANEVGDEALSRALRKCLRRYQRRSVLKQMDSFFLAGRVRGIAQKFRKAPSSVTESSKQVNSKQPGF